MDNNTFEYILKLKDEMSSILDKIGVSSEKDVKNFNALKSKVDELGSHMDKAGSKAEGFWTRLKGSGAAKGFASVLNIIKGNLATIGLSFGMFQFIEMAKGGIEKAHALHEAEAQLANTMQNMGVYSKESFDTAVSGAKKLASQVKYSSADMIELQSQLRMVGKMGDNEMNRMAMAAADMSSKFGIGLNEAGNAIAKAINNPEMMKRLGQMIKIDPAVSDRIQKLAKDGKEAQARMELLTVVEGKVGGAAKAAFNADPLARYNKAVGSLKVKLGEVIVDIQQKLAPVFLILAKVAMSVFEKIKIAFDWLAEKIKTYVPIIISTVWKFLPLIVGLTAAIAAYNIVVNAAAIKTLIFSGIQKTIIFFTNMWAAAQAVLNAIMTLNPVGLIIAAVVALIAVIAVCILKISGWGEAWDYTVKAIKALWSGFVSYIKLMWLTAEDYLLSGIEKIKKGWAGLKSLWDKKGANELLAQIKKDSDDRQAAIKNETKKLVDSSVSAFKDFKNAKDSFSVKEGPSFSEMKDKMMGFLGISSPSGVPGSNLNGGNGAGAGGGTGAGSSGKEKTNNAIATGGQRTNYITINLGNLIGDVKVSGRDFKESVNKMEEQVSDALLRVLATAQAAGG